MNKLSIDNLQFTSLVHKLCRDITLSEFRPDYIVGITRGGLIPAIMVSQYFDIPMEALKISLRDQESCESNLWMAEDAYNDKKILVVDDINDTGNTINWLMEDWQSGCYPDDDRWNHVWNNNVRFLVLFDNLSSKSNVKMDYVGAEVNKKENDVWIDFPWEDWWTKNAN